MSDQNDAEAVKQAMRGKKAEPADVAQIRAELEREFAAKLAQKDAEHLAERLQNQAELDLLRQQQQQQGTRGPGYNAADVPFAGDGGGMLFRVGPERPQHEGLYPVKEVRACDAGEAKRWYAVTTPDPARPGKALDVLTVPLKVENLEQAKLDLRIRHRKQLAMIRVKIDSGTALTPAEEQMLAEAEFSIL